MSDAGAVGATRSVRLWPALLAVAALACALFGPAALRGWLVSDDYLLFAFLREDATGALMVDWPAVLADFARPWAGLDSDFYRPLLSVSFATDLQLFGPSPRGMHVTNLVLHAAVAAMTARMCALFAPGRPLSAALVGGAWVAVHPVAVEPVLWLAARNSELEVFFRTLAMLAFALHLKRGSRAARHLAVAAGIAAFASKESAVVLPVSLLALDLIDDHRRPWRERVRLHAPFVLLLIAYFVWRTVLFGHPVGTGGPAEPQTFAMLLANLESKLSALVADLEGFGGVTAGALLALGAVAAGVSARTRVAVPIAVAWLLAHTASTWSLHVGPELAGSRLVYGMLPPTALLIAAVMLAPARSRAPLTVLAWIAVLGLALASREHVQRYDEAWRDARAAEAGIAALAGRTDDGRPLALCAMPVTPPGVPPNNPNAWFPFAERPVQPRDVPVVSLGYMTVPVPGAEDLHGDASAVRAMWHAGAPVAAWLATDFTVRQRAKDAAPPALVASPESPGVFRFASPAPPDVVEALEVEGPEHLARDGGTLRFVTALPDVPAELATLPFGPGIVENGRARFSIDLSHAMLPATLATLGQPLLGFALTFDAGAPEDVSLRGLPRVPLLATSHEPFAGAVVDAVELDVRLVAPQATGAGALRLILLGPTGAFAVHCEPGERVALPDRLRSELAIVRRLAREPRLWLWFETVSPPGRAGFARSATDWLRLR